jgi:microcystin-dependent protein
MAQPYVGEIRMFAGTYAPAGWNFCDGQLLAISENETLFQLIGTTYGGDGQSTFGLPDLRGRLPLHQSSQAGNVFLLGQAGGEEAVTLTVNQIPSHPHAWLASAAAAVAQSPRNLVLATTQAQSYVNQLDGPSLSPLSVSNVGGSQPHTNLQPYLCIQFIISLFGIFPSAA